jgi:tetratricopeptide (TPR) repeat protein
LAYGANKNEGLKMFKVALKLNPNSTLACIQYANGLLMLEGKKQAHEAPAIYEEAAACKSPDAMERLGLMWSRQRRSSRQADILWSNIGCPRLLCSDRG